MNSFLKKILHIFPVLPLMLVMLSGCVDDYFESDSTTAVNPDVVSFATSVSKGEPLPELARGGSKPLYDPLLLGDESGEEKLYLHTYDADEVGFNPETSQPDTSKGGVQSRGLQVESVQDLISIHKDFLVHARFADNPEEEFIEWSTAKQVTGDNTIWQPYKTRYWPIDEVLAFHAVAPAAEYSGLQGLALGDNTMSFSYSAKTPTGDSKNKDAEAQTDLLIAASKCNKAGSDAGKAPLQFHHALSAIKFAIRDVANGTIDNIKISGVYGTADCVYTYADKPVDPNPDEPTDPWQGTIAWSNHRDLKTGDAAYSQDFAFAFKQTSEEIKPGDDTHDISIDGKMPEKTFMLIPQAIPDDAEIIVTITRDDPNFGDKKTVTLRGKIKANGVDEWLPGHEYIYTISSTADNWVYVFDVIGNHNTDLSINKHFSDEDGNDHAWNDSANMIFVYAPMNPEFDKFEEKAHFHVKSYRYRANNHSRIELLPWEASYGDEPIKQYESPQKVGEPITRPVADILKDPGYYIENRDLPNEEWIEDRSALKGEGSDNANGEIKRFRFAAHHAVSNWKGDLDMQDSDPYDNNSESNPWDLSTCSNLGSEGGLSRNTANTYVVDRGGWYVLPAVYGNAIKNGADNVAAYNPGRSGSLPSSQETSTRVTYEYLPTFVGYDNKAIQSPWIPLNNTHQAVLVWADVYNAVSDVSLFKHTDGNYYVKFKVNSQSMLQGNVVLAITGKDTSTAIWSWTIWVTEHWLDPDTGRPHAFHESTKFTEFEPSGDPKRPEQSGAGRRQRGDLQTSIPDYENYKYYVSPYNLGWCDPKTRHYLRRVGEMEFVQYRKDNGNTVPTGRAKTLPVIQNGLEITYRYGNNTYYQFGRKDAMVGFIDHNNTIKRNFGPYQYRIVQCGQTLGYSIQHPNTLLSIGYSTDGPNSKGAESTKGAEWCDKSYINLWNNYNSSSEISMNNEKCANHALCLNGVKTVYDPCPPGYMVPPASLWRIVGSADGKNYYDVGSNKKNLNKNTNFYGIYRGEAANAPNDDEKYYSYVIFADRTKSKTEKNNWIFLASTGHRWYSDYHTPAFKAGDNFNPQIVYLWSSTSSVNMFRGAMCLALGFETPPNNVKPWGQYLDGDKKGQDYDQWVICSYFDGRRSMARPVRPVREEYSK